MNFSFLGGLANLLPGYVQGQRQAIQDNWQDLMNYNRAQQGQLSNVFTEATWQPRVDMFQDAWLNSLLNTYGHIADARQKEILRPYSELQAGAYTYYAQPLAGIGPLSTLKQWEYLNRNPSAFWQGAAGSTPSSQR